MQAETARSAFGAVAVATGAPVKLFPFPNAPPEAPKVGRAANLRRENRELKIDAATHPDAGDLAKLFRLFRNGVRDTFCTVATAFYTPLKPVISQK